MACHSDRKDHDENASCPQTGHLVVYRRRLSDGGEEGSDLENVLFPVRPCETFRSDPLAAEKDVRMGSHSRDHEREDASDTQRLSRDGSSDQALLDERIDRILSF